MLIAGFPSPMTATNCWVVATGAGEQCVVIDPGLRIGPQLDDLIAEHRLHPVAVLLTHGHIDHTFSVLPVCQARDVPAYIHPATLAEPDDVRALADGDAVPLAGLKFGVRHAPGHTRGSVVFGLDEVLFSGDVLFAGSIGRVDLPGGSMAEMTTSLREVILPLPDQTVIHPGHGPSTTMERERMSNQFLLDLLDIQ